MPPSRRAVAVIDQALLAVPKLVIMFAWLLLGTTPAIFLPPLLSAAWALLITVGFVWWHAARSDLPGGGRKHTTLRLRSLPIRALPWLLLLVPPLVRLSSALAGEPASYRFSDTAIGLMNGGAEYSDGKYLGMLAAGTLGSAVGLLAGFAGAAMLTVASTGCIDCGEGIPPLAYLVPAVTTSLVTAAAVTAVAHPPESTGFVPGLRETIRSEAFTPALVGAVAGLATGALFGYAVDRTSPPDEPYGILAFNVGQSAASVFAVRLWSAP